MTKETSDVIVSSRVRLVRNLKDHVFPSKLDRQQAIDLVEDVHTKLLDLGLNYKKLWTMDEFHKQALIEQKILSSELAKSKRPMGLLMNDEKTESILLGGNDHFRLQFSLPGVSLRETWEQVNRLDDKIGEVFDYAFNEKYGYLTAFPTNVGTGLRASCILHLPILSKSKTFKSLQEEMSRIGLNLKAMGENNGDLYRLSNQKTLGQSESDLVESVERIALQLAGQEQKVQEDALKKQYDEIEDEVYKSFGVLKYARKLSVKEAMMYLSQLRLGVCSGVISLDKEVDIYQLMIGSLPGNLKVYAGKDLENSEILKARAAYLREQLPNLSSERKN
ncbi:putative ATP:guanido phosphotransferase YacI [Lachnospiraceae bacterium TWA4]|nr:putative ATP:guanido phosphotransferase YacI [Lachnospiraceae bacterium TWA4]